MNNILVFFGYKDYPYEINEDNLFDIIDEREESGYYMYEKYPMLYVSDKTKCIGIPIYYGEDIKLSFSKFDINLEKIKDLDREFYCLLSENEIMYNEECEPSINVINLD